MTLTLQIIYTAMATITFIVLLVINEKKLEYAYNETIIVITFQALVWFITIPVALWELWKEWRG